MNLYKNVFFPLRERTGFGACDCGLLLWRSNFLPLAISFAIPLTVLAAAGSFLSADINTIIFTSVTWWLKPLFDRLALHIIQIRFFNKDAQGKTLYKGIFKNTLKALAGDLLWRRFSIKRSVIMPIRILESLKGQKLLKRKKTLERGGIGFGIFLTIFCLCLEVLLFASTLVFYYFLEEVSSYLEIFSGENSSFWLCAIPYLINYIIVETMYVCCGFSLYINSRVIVEGWDLQLILDVGGIKK
ncbi:MAG: hypothetical protein Ta2B_06070 [Termitinemataceae bacterium]|nr:MAG: hypothetical protein Ta2B_06070 [Termitinemataceae bacterium]